MKRIMAGLLALGLAFAVAGCGGTSTNTDQPADGSTQESAPAADEPAEPTGSAMIEEVDEVPEDIAKFVRGSEDLFMILGGVEVSVDNMQVAQRIPSYFVTEIGVVEGDELWPIYVDGELTGIVYKQGDYISLDFHLLEFLKGTKLDRLAVVYDSSTIWFCDGTQLIEAGSMLEVVSGRVPVTEDNEAEVMAACKLGRLGAIIGGVAE